MSIFKSIKIDSNNPTGDPFGRLRVSNPITEFDSKQLHDKLPLFWDDSETSGSGTTSTYDINRAGTTIGVALNTAGTRLRRTFRRFNYEPGKGLSILFTGVLDASGGGSGITRRIGYYDDNDGLFFEDAGGTYRVVRRTSTSGVPVDNGTSQASWNIDPLDGTGNSGITIDFTKAQIFVIDFEWLGVGRVRMGFNIDGVTYYCHEIDSANNLDVVFMKNPNLPISYEIINDGTGAASTLEHLCSTVLNEGGSNTSGVVRAASTGGTHIDLATENVVYALIGIRLKSTHQNETVKIISKDILISTASEQMEWILYWNPTFSAGSLSFTGESNSAIEVAKGDGTQIISGGTVIDIGYLSSDTGGAGTGTSRQILENALTLGSSISGISDVILLAGRPIGGTSALDVECSLTWRELS